jgi:hypothetical protein
MKIRYPSVCVLIASGILVFTAGPGQAEVGGGPSPGGSMGGGSGNFGESKGSMNQNRTHGREPSGPMGQGRPEMTRPGQGGEVPLGRPPDSSGSNPAGPGGGLGAGSGSSGMGSSGSTGSSGGMGSGGGMGSSGGAGGGGK